MKILLLCNPARFHYIKVYVMKGGAVHYKHTDGRKFKDLDTFKKEYEKHFKSPPKFKTEKS